MEQQKALNALEPFLALSKSASSPRAAADLITRATSAPSTYLFAELLQTPQISSLANDPDFASHHKLLQVFSYGTYETYTTTTAAQGGLLPELNPEQTLKLRQLSLLTLAKDRENLSYERLKASLGLGSNVELEGLVTTAIYANLLNAVLDPARQVVQVQSIAPLRDLVPGSIPNLLSSLQNWSSRCDTTLSDLDQQIKAIRAAAAAREVRQRENEEKLELAVNELIKKDVTGEGGPGGMAMGSQRMPTRGYAPNVEEEMMEVDDPGTTEEERRANKRKL